MFHLLAYAAIVLSVILEIPMAAMMLGVGETSFSISLVFHILSTAACATGFYLLSEKPGPRLKRGNIWWIYALVACAVMPMYGVLSTILIFALQRKAKSKPPPIVSDEITVQSADVFVKPLTRTKQLEVLERLDIEPFVDIFRRGQSELKKSAVKFLSSIESQAAMKTLNRALMDNDIEVRLYAAGVIGLIDDRYALEIDTQRKRLANNPQDAATCISLADLYLAYAESGLLDQIASTYYYKEAFRILSEFPQDADINYRQARSLFALGQLDEAKEKIERCLNVDSANIDYNRLHCEILFARREYDATVQAVERMRTEELSPADDEVIKFWA
ncbi:MAG: hypothetical protein WC956_01155 [bacterium]